MRPEDTRNNRVRRGDRIYLEEAQIKFKIDLRMIASDPPVLHPLFYPLCNQNIELARFAEEGGEGNDRFGGRLAK